MRIIRAFCNVGIFLVAFIVINFVGLAAFNVMSWGVNSVDSIHIASSDNKKVNFWDGYDFVVTDMKVNLKTEPKPYVRNFFGGKGLWADHAINFVTGVAKPIVFPHVQLDNLAETRSGSVYEDLLLDYSAGTNQRPSLNKSYVNDRERLGALIELSTFSNINPNLLGVESISKNDNVITIQSRSGKIIVATIERIVDSTNSMWIASIEYGEKIFTYEMFTEKNIDYATAKSSKILSDEYLQWAIRGNDLLANRYWQSNKYSDKSYDEFVSKFFVLEYDGENSPIMVDSRNKPIIKTEGIFLFIIQFISIIIALIFAIKYPASIIQARVSRMRGGKNDGGSPGIVI